MRGLIFAGVVACALLQPVAAVAVNPIENTDQRVTDSKVSQTWQQVRADSGDTIWNMCKEFRETQWKQCAKEFILLNRGKFPGRLTEEKDFFLNKGTTYLAPVPGAAASAGGVGGPVVSLTALPPLSEPMQNAIDAAIDKELAAVDDRVVALERGQLLLWAVLLVVAIMAFVALSRSRKALQAVGEIRKKVGDNLLRVNMLSQAYNDVMSLIWGIDERVNDLEVGMKILVGEDRLEDFLPDQGCLDALDAGSVLVIEMTRTDGETGEVVLRKTDGGDFVVLRGIRDWRTKHLLQGRRDRMLVVLGAARLNGRIELKQPGGVIGLVA